MDLWRERIFTSVMWCGGWIGSGLDRVIMLYLLVEHPLRIFCGAEMCFGLREVCLRSTEC